MNLYLFTILVILIVLIPKFIRLARILYLKHLGIKILVMESMKRLRVNNINGMFG